MSTQKSADTVVKPLEKAPVIDYNLSDTGEITRTDKEGTIEVASFTSGKLVLIEEWARFRPAIVRFLNEAGTPPTSITMEGDEDEKPKAQVIPPMPKKEMRFGDKTPAVVEWYRKYHPAEYKARYGIKGDGQVTKTRTVIHPETGIPYKEAFTVDCIIADRKIKGTEKAEANQAVMGGADSEYSD